MITEFYEISKQEEKKLRDACEKEEIVMDHLQQEHQNEINAFINKYRHLEYDHDMFINDYLSDFELFVNFFGVFITAVKTFPINIFHVEDESTLIVIFIRTRITSVTAGQSCCKQGRTT